VQDYPDAGRTVSPGVLGDPSGGQGDDFPGDRIRPGTQALVHVPENVAVIAGQIAATARLEREFPEGNDASEYLAPRYTDELVSGFAQVLAAATRLHENSVFDPRDR
jgi:hypothetical protein